MFSFLSNDVLKYSLIGVLTVLLIVVIVIIVLLTKHGKEKKDVKNFQNRVEELNVFATSHFSVLLNRLNAIASVNDSYKEIYERHKITHDSIVAKHKDVLNTKVNVILDLCTNKKYKLVKEKLEEAEIVYNAYYRQIHELEENMQQYLSKDDECHEYSLSFKRDYQDIKDLYLSHADELSFIYPSLNKIFTKIEVIFQEFDDLCNAALYDEAINKISQTKDVLDALKDYLDKIPALCARLNLVIPNKIEELKTRYAEFESANYPLHHLRFNKNIEDFENLIAALKNKISNFKLKNISTDLDFIDQSITSLHMALDEEKKARDFFDTHFENAYKNSASLEKRFIKISRTMPEYKKVYSVQEKYIEDVSSLQEKINLVAKIKREIDTFMHSSSQQPYTVQVKKLNELMQENELIDTTLTTFQNYIKSLKTDSELAYSTLNEKFVSLKELEYRLRELNLPDYEEKLKEQFAKAYKTLNNIGMLISTSPINVEALNFAVSQIINYEDMLNKEISTKEKSSIDAEATIVYANKFRQEFHDAKQALNDAEKYFFAYDFDKASQITLETIKRIDPKYR